MARKFFTQTLAAILNDDYFASFADIIAYNEIIYLSNEATHSHDDSLELLVQPSVRI